MIEVLARVGAQQPFGAGRINDTEEITKRVGSSPATILASDNWTEMVAGHRLTAMSQSPRLSGR